MKDTDHNDDAIPPMTSELREELERRLTEARANPSERFTWDSVKEEFRIKRQKNQA